MSALKAALKRVPGMGPKQADIEADRLLSSGPGSPFVLRENVGAWLAVLVVLDRYIKATRGVGIESVTISAPALAHIATIGECMNASLRDLRRVQVDLSEATTPHTETINLGSLTHDPLSVEILGGAGGLDLVVPASAFGQVRATTPQLALMGSTVRYAGISASSSQRSLQGLIHFRDSKDGKSPTSLEFQRQVAELNLNGKVAWSREFPEEEGRKIICEDLSAQYLVDTAAEGPPTASTQGRPMSFLPYATPEALQRHLGQESLDITLLTYNSEHRPAFAIFDDKGFGAALAQEFSVMKPGEVRLIFVETRDSSSARSSEERAGHMMVCKLRVSEDALGSRSALNYEAVLYDPNATATDVRLNENHPARFSDRSLSDFLPGIPASAYLGDEYGTLSRWPITKQSRAGGKIPTAVYASDECLVNSPGFVREENSSIRIARTQAILRSAPARACKLLDGMLETLVNEGGRGTEPGEIRSFIRSVVASAALDPAEKVTLLAAQPWNLSAPPEPAIVDEYVRSIVDVVGPGLSRDYRDSLLETFVRRCCVPEARTSSAYLANKALHAYVGAVVGSRVLSAQEKGALLFCDSRGSSLARNELQEWNPGALVAMRGAIQAFSSSRSEKDALLKMVGSIEPPGHLAHALPHERTDAEHGEEGERVAQTSPTRQASPPARRSAALDELVKASRLALKSDDEAQSLACAKAGLTAAWASVEGGSQDLLLCESSEPVAHLQRFRVADPPDAKGSSLSRVRYRIPVELLRPMKIIGEPPR